MERVSDEIDDSDRLWWRACILEHVNAKKKNACEIIQDRNQRYTAYFSQPSYESALRADHRAGGQEGLLARAMDGAVVGTVPDIDPDAVTYTPPANDKKE